MPKNNDADTIKVIKIGPNPVQVSADDVEETPLRVTVRMPRYMQLRSGGSILVDLGWGVDMPPLTLGIFTALLELSHRIGLSVTAGMVTSNQEVRLSVTNRSTRMAEIPEGEVLGHLWFVRPRELAIDVQVAPTEEPKRSYRSRDGVVSE